MLPETGDASENRYFMFTSNEDKICLAVNYSIEKSSVVLSLFAPYWMVNYTNEDIVYRVDDKHIYKHHKDLSTPLLLCFDPDRVSKKDKLSLAISASLYSEYFPLNAVPYNASFLPQSKSKKFAYCVNVKVELARLGLSKIITVSSFYSIWNISKEVIEYSENNEDWFSIETECSKPFFPTRSNDQTMCFRFAGTEYDSKVCRFNVVLIYLKY